MPQPPSPAAAGEGGDRTPLSHRNGRGAGGEGARQPSQHSALSTQHSALAPRQRAAGAVHRSALGFDADWDVTIGTATFPEDGETLEDLLQAADRRLYRQRGIEVTSAED